MKRILFAIAAALSVSPALAADLPPPGPAPVAPAYYKSPEPAYYNWSGFYLGINGGGAFGTSTWNDPVFGSTGGFSTSGFLVGGTVGGNYQFGSFVVGLEGDIDWANLSGSTTVTSCAPYNCATSSDWLGTARVRAGYAWDRILFYGTGGAAFGDIDAYSGYLPTASNSNIGWTVGGGIEGAFAPNWTAKVEYLYVDLGSMSCGFANCGGTTTTVSLTENVIRAGINYKFGW
jgi:outer membrane immunogenic protein